MDSKSPKRKSERRFAQLNQIVDEIAPTLPTASHVAVLLACYRHGRGAGFFRVSTARVAKSVRLSKRQTQRVLDDLERADVVTLVTEHSGPIPRTYKISFRAFNGDTHDTIKTKPTTHGNGDTHDR